MKTLKQCEDLFVYNTFLKGKPKTLIFAGINIYESDYLVLITNT